MATEVAALHTHLRQPTHAPQQLLSSLVWQLVVFLGDLCQAARSLSQGLLHQGLTPLPYSFGETSRRSGLLIPTTLRGCLYPSLCHTPISTLLIPSRDSLTTDLLLLISYRHQYRHLLLLRLREHLPAAPQIWNCQSLALIFMHATLRHPFIQQPRLLRSAGTCSGYTTQKIVHRLLVQGY